MRRGYVEVLRDEVEKSGHDVCPVGYILTVRIVVTV